MKYVAYAGPDDFVESSDDLDELIRILREIVDPDIPEDVAIWEDDRKLVAVVLEDGTVVRFDRPRPMILPLTPSKTRPSRRVRR